MYDYKCMLRLANVLMKYSKYKRYMELVGSLGRKDSKRVKDIDIITTIRPYRIVRDLNKVFDINIVMPKKEAKVYKFRIEYDAIFIRVDIFYTKPKYYMFAKLHYMGPKEYVIKLALKARKRGYSLTNKGLLSLRRKKYLKSVKTLNQLMKIIKN